jgi:hypothetical protein
MTELLSKKVHELTKADLLKIEHALNGMPTVAHDATLGEVFGMPVIIPAVSPKDPNPAGAIRRK